MAGFYRVARKNVWGGHSCPPPLTLVFEAFRSQQQKSTSKSADKSARPTQLGRILATKMRF
jgi:hypothetical protein